MSTTYLRLRIIDGELVIVPNKSSSGYNYDLFLAALQEMLNEKEFIAEPRGEPGTSRDRYLLTGDLQIRFKQGSFTFQDEHGNKHFETKTDDPLTEALSYVKNNISITS